MAVGGRIACSLMAFTAREELAKMKLIGVINVHRIARFCFLKEALHWVAFNKLPLAFTSYEEEEVDGRFDSLTYDGLQEFLDEVGVISNQECAFARIPPNPRADPEIEGLGTSDWDRRYRAAIERAKSDLFPELSDGKIRLLGRRFDKAKYGRFEDIDFYEVDQSDAPYRPIPPSDKTDITCVVADFRV